MVRREMKYENERRFCGNIIYDGSTISQVLFDGGYITFDEETDEPLYHFYITDHQGNNRVVVDANGNVEEYNHYYPYGALMNISSASTQPYKYNGKELNRLNRLLWYDQSARQYNPILGRFMSMDPLCEKYYSISPYAFCANNPVRYVDKDGRKIRYAKNVTKEFKEAFAKACIFMKKCGTKKWLDVLEERPETIYIRQAQKSEAQYDAIRDKNGNVIGKTGTGYIINFNPRQWIITSKGVLMSPETVLVHEAAHMLQILKNYKQFLKDRKTKDEEYDNKEERRVITTDEQEAAAAHGDIYPGEVTRTDHKGKRIDMAPASAQEPTTPASVSLIPEEKEE